MKKITIFLITAALILTFILYRSISIPLTPKIEAAKLLESPLSGEWYVEKYATLRAEDGLKETAEKYIGKTAHFSNDSIFFNEEGFTKPNYKIKLVNSKDYFWDNYKVRTQPIGIDKEYLQIVTISSKEHFLDEYIKIDENHAAKYHEGILLFFRKKTNENTPDSIDEHKSIDYAKLASSKEKESRAKSGLLLGLKYNNNYRTLWISKIDTNYMDITETKDILLPRMTGFWKIGADNDSLWATPIIDNNRLPTEKGNKSTKDLDNLSILFEGIKFKRHLDNVFILFAGSDFISISSDNTLQVLPLDNLQGDAVSLSRTLGSEKNSSSLDGFNNNSLTQAKGFNQTNWGIFRRGGRWILRGREILSKDNEYKDFDIAYAAPKSLTVYDDLYPSFNTVKTKIPEAVDAFTSPNRDFAVVLTSKKLLVVSIQGNTLGEVKQSLDLFKNETPVMAHWALGYYVDEWQKKVK